MKIIAEEIDFGKDENDIYYIWFGNSEKEPIEYFTASIVRTELIKQLIQRQLT